MKARLIIPAVLLTFLFGQVSYAQITVLPKALDDMNVCKTILDQFEADGKVPIVSEAQKDVADTNAQTNLEAAQAAVQNAQAALDNANNSAMDFQHDASVALAQENLDKANKSLAEAQKAATEAHDAHFDNKTDNSKPSDRDNLLGCAIKTGRISLIMIPYFITYFANYLLSIVGILSVLFIVLGGYFYIWGGITEKKDKGKAYITHALMGLAIATLAWVIVNAVMAIFTS